MLKGEAGAQREAADSSARNDVLRAVAVAANQADALPDAAQVALDTVCGLTGWPVGRLYLVAGDGGAELFPTSVCHVDDPEHYRPLPGMSHLTWLTTVVGLPGRVLGDPRRVWVPDVTAWAGFLRAAAAADLGITSALGVPVLAGDDVVAVLEFLSVVAVAPDGGLLGLLDEVGRQLGRVAERARATDALRISEERTRRILETAGDAFVSMDAAGLITAWNRQAELTFGWPAAEAIGRPLAETIIPERHRQRHSQGVTRFLATGEATILRRRLELVALHRDGREVPVELTVWPGPVDCEPGHREFNAFLHDISDRAADQTALRESERQLAQAQRLAGIGSCCWDVAGGAGHWSDELYRMCGLAPGGVEPTLASFLALIHPADRDRARLRIQTAHRTGVPFELEHRVVLPAGDERVFGVRGEVVHDDGRPDRMTVMAQDVTERRAAEAALERYATDVAAANAELQAAHELKDHFLAVTNHELRSPLTTILGFAAMLNQHWDAIPDQDRRDSIARIEHQGRRLLRLVEDLLTLSSVQAGALELSMRPFEVGAVIEEAVLHSGLAPEDVTVSCPPGLAVTADFDRLIQILENYLTNSGKYGAPPYRVEAVAAGGGVELRVTDAGEGVPDDFVPHLFAKFVQASAGRSRRAKGSGLGLAIVQDLARAHGGDAWYEPASPRGSCFAVRLPAPAAVS